MVTKKKDGEKQIGRRKNQWEENTKKEHEKTQKEQQVIKRKEKDLNKGETKKLQ